MSFIFSPSWLLLLNLLVWYSIRVVRVESGVLDLSWNDFSLSHSCDIHCWYVTHSPIILRNVSSMPNLWRVFFFFFDEVLLNLIKCFLCICWDDRTICVHHSIDVIYENDWLVYVELSLCFWNRFLPGCDYDHFDAVFEKICDYVFNLSKFAETWFVVYHRKYSLCWW